MTELWEVVAERAPLWQSRLHGEQHANRVAATGVKLATQVPKADAAVVFAFGMLHDSQRTNDSNDHRHGVAAAEFAQELHEAGLLELDGIQMETLLPALRWHSKIVTSTDPTVGCCFDADRLNLARLRIRIKPSRLSTAAAPAIVEWAAATLDEFVPWQQIAADAGYGTATC